MPETTGNPLELFYCYASEDEELRRDLDNHLSILRHLNLIRAWHLGDISPGTEWEPEIDRHLRAADLILLLVSSTFLASDYYYGREMEQALQRHKEGTARVVPIILRPVDYEGAPFSRLRVLPTGARPVTSWRDHNEAYKDIVKGLRRVIGELQASRRTAADGWSQKGVALNEQGCYEEAIHALDKAIQLNSNDARIYSNKGFALNQLRSYEEAILALDKAIQLDPCDAHASYNKGFALRKLQRYGEAIHAFDKAIQLNPNDTDAYHNKGIVLRHLQRYEEAIVAFDKAIQLNPNDAKVYINKGSVLNDLKRHEDALVVFDKAIQLNPNDLFAYYTKGVALWHFLQRYEEAIVVFNQAQRCRGLR